MSGDSSTPRFMRRWYASSRGALAPGNRDQIETRVVLDLPPLVSYSQCSQLFVNVRGTRRAAGKFEELRAPSVRVLDTLWEDPCRAGNHVSHCALRTTTTPTISVASVAASDPTTTMRTRMVAG